MKDNALRFIIKHFKKHLVENYSKFITQYYENQIDLKTLTMRQSDLKVEITAFTKIFMNTLLYYYHLEEFSQKNYGGLLTRENFWNFIITIIFDHNVYSMIYAFYKIIDEAESKVFIK